MQIMYIEHVLGAEDAKADGAEDEAYDVVNDPGAAMAFLKARPMARIIIVVDTHCLENGFFMYVGDSPVSLMGCALLEVCPALNHPSDGPHIHARSSRTVSPIRCLRPISPLRNVPPTTTTRALLSTSHAARRSPWMAHAVGCSKGWF